MSAKDTLKAQISAILGREVVIEKPKDKTRISVDTIRKLNDDAAIKPFNAPRKVYIIKSHQGPMFLKCLIL